MEQNKFYQIKNITEDKYTLVGCDGSVTTRPIQEVDKSASAFHIQDAKDGDVLAINWHEGDDSWEKIIIFKKYHNKGVKGLYSMPCVEGYGNTFKNGKIAIKEEVPYYSTTWTCNLHPATKEQRDLLFQKMKETGYEWDAEKKELKKIEQVRAKWSEEDELSCFESALFTAFSDAWQSYLLGEDVNVKQWAKEQSKELLEAAKEELKGHNSAWSEEDERICQCLIQDQEEALDEVRNDKYGHSEIISDLKEMYRERIDWLKSLRPHN